MVKCLNLLLSQYNIIGELVDKEFFKSKAEAIRNGLFNISYLKLNSYPNNVGEKKIFTSELFDFLEDDIIKALLVSHWDSASLLVRGSLGSIDNIIASKDLELNDSFRNDKHTNLEKELHDRGVRLADRLGVGFSELVRYSLRARYYSKFGLDSKVYSNKCDKVQRTMNLTKDLMHHVKLEFNNKSKYSAIFNTALRNMFDYIDGKKIELINNVMVPMGSDASVLLKSLQKDIDLKSPGKVFYFNIEESVKEKLKLIMNNVDVFYFAKLALIAHYQLGMELTNGELNGETVQEFTELPVEFYDKFKSDENHKSITNAAIKSLIKMI